MDLTFPEGGVDSSECGDTYPGPGPFSEVESRNVRDFMSSRLIQTPILALCLHSYSQLWMHPYGYSTEAVPENVQDYLRVGQAAVDAIFRTHGRVYKNMHSADNCKFLDRALMSIWPKFLADFRSCGRSPAVLGRKFRG